MRLAMRGSFIIATGLAFALPMTAQAQNLDVRGWIDRPGVKSQAPGAEILLRGWLASVVSILGCI